MNYTINYVSHRLWVDGFVNFNKKLDLVIKYQVRDQIWTFRRVNSWGIPGTITLGAYSQSLWIIDQDILNKYLISKQELEQRIAQYHALQVFE